MEKDKGRGGGYGAGYNGRYAGGHAGRYVGQYDGRYNGRGGDGRRRRRQKNGLMFLIGAVFCAGVIVALAGLYARLEKLQRELDRIEIRQGAGLEESLGESGQIKAVTAYGRTSGTDVSKPVERTRGEVLERLEELGRVDDTIRDVWENASQYPDALLAALANNPEMADFAADYPDGGTESGEGLTEAEKAQDFPLFLQWDPRWGYQPYGEQSCVGLAGCGPTCLSMTLYYLTGNDRLTPDAIAAYSMENGYYVEGSGTAWLLMEDLPARYGIGVRSLSLSFQNMTAALDHGGIIICAMGKGDFTTAGHFIVIYGYDGEGFRVNDPNCVARSERKWSYSELSGQIKNLWVYTI